MKACKWCGNECGPNWPVDQFCSNKCKQKDKRKRFSVLEDSVLSVPVNPESKQELTGPIA